MLAISFIRKALIQKFMSYVLSFYIKSLYTFPTWSSTFFTLREREGEEGREWMRDIERKRNSQHWNLSFSLSGVDLYGLVCISCFFILDIFMLICELQCLCCMICNTCLLNAICIATILLINAYMTSISITVWRDGMSEFSSSLKASVFDLLSYM